MFTLRCPSSLSYMNEYLAIGSGGYLYELLSRINCGVAEKVKWCSNEDRVLRFTFYILAAARVYGIVLKKIKATNII